MNAKKNTLQFKLKRNVPLDYISAFITSLNMQSSIWVLYLAYCGLSLAQIGLLEGIYHATSIVFEIPSGALADLLGRKKSMLLGRICIGISCVIMLFSKSFGLFSLSFIIQALGNNFNSGSEEALVYDSMKYIGQEEHYMRVYGRLNIIIEVSQGIATVAGGILAEYSYFWCYGACVVIAVLSLLPVLLLTEAPCDRQGKERTTVRELVTAHFSACFRILRWDARILKNILFYSVVFAAQTLLFFYSQQYYHEYGYNKIEISLILLAVSLASCAGAALSEKIYRRLGKKVVALSTVFIAGSLISYGFENIGVSVGAFCTAGFFNSVLYPVQSDSLNQLIPSEQRATLISVNSLFFSVAMILLFPAAGALADHMGLTVVLAGIGLAVLAFAAVFALIVIPFPVSGQKQRRHRRSQCLRRNDGDPDAVDAPEYRENQDRGDLKHHGPQEGNHCGDQAVVQSGEKSRSIDGDA